MSNASLAQFLINIFETARADIALVALVPADKILGHIPQDDSLPYVRIHISNSPDWSTKCQLGFESSLVCDIWSEHHDDGEVLKIADELIRIFSTEMVLDSGQNVTANHISTITTIEPDGQTHRASSSFNLKITSN